MSSSSEVTKKRRIMTGRGRERGNAIEEEESEREKRGASTSSSTSFLSLSQPQPKLTKKKHALSHTRTLPELTKKPVDGFSAGLVGDSLFEWAVTVMGPPDTLYEGGFFNARLTFPPDYPQSPPTCRFTSEVWHPNVYADGRVCISILHNPGDDPTGYERASERWSPVHTVETIMLSIISMLSSPNDESPANVDAAKEWREDREGFKKRVARCVRRSQEELS